MLLNDEYDNKIRPQWITVETFMLPKFPIDIENQGDSVDQQIEDQYEESVTLYQERIIINDFSQDHYGDILPDY